jgi:outer membrane murein-binding lipoprotein Lpp
MAARTRLSDVGTTSTWRRIFVTIAVPSLLVFSGCSSESALCQSIDDLRSDVQSLRDVNVVDDGIDALTTQIDAVKGSLSDVKQEAEDTFASDIDAVEASLTDIESVVQLVQGGTALADVATEATTALSSLVTSIESLVQTVDDQECG